MKKIIAIVFSLVIGATLFAEQLTTVGVVDVNTVYNSFFQDSLAVRELEELRNSNQQELDGYVAQLRQLQERHLEAVNDGRRTEALELDQQIFELTEYIQDFQRVKQRQLRDRQERLVSSESFLRQLNEALAYVAEAQGFTILITKNDEKILWVSQEVDITDLVLERLRSTSR